jgi:hypothetical protein
MWPSLVDIAILVNGGVENSFCAVSLNRYGRRASDIPPDKGSPLHKVFVPSTKIVERDWPESGSAERFAGMRADIASAANHQKPNPSREPPTTGLTGESRVASVLPSVVAHTVDPDLLKELLEVRDRAGQSLA